MKVILFAVTIMVAAIPAIGTFFTLSAQTNQLRNDQTKLEGKVEGNGELIMEQRIVTAEIGVKLENIKQVMDEQKSLSLEILRRLRVGR